MRLPCLNMYLSIGICHDFYIYGRSKNCFFFVGLQF